MPYRACKNRSTYGGEAERVDFDTECRNVLLLELSGQMALDESGLEGIWSALVYIGAVL
jgi:hypothetical protein